MSGTHYNFTFAPTATSVFTWDAAKNALTTPVSGEACYIGTYGGYYTMSVLRSSKYQDTDYVARFYTFDGEDTPPDTSCQHNYTSVITAPTCTKEGFTTYTCSLCAYSCKGDTVAAKGHSYVNDTCTVCGTVKPAANNVTISFADTANRTEFTTSKQVWVQNGITVTNDKASSTVNVADYANPARFYAGSNVTISYLGITKIEINCKNS